MKAVLATPELIDAVVAEPTPGPHDLLLRVEALAVNPVDTKVRAGIPPGSEGRILGWDAAGVVEACGEAVSRFRPGDAVMVAGDIRRAGCYAERLVVDGRLCGRRPQALSWAESACLPLTGLTAWEGLFEGLGLDPDGGTAGRSLLILGGAWARELGAEQVVDHSQPLAPQLAALGLEQVDAIANFADTDAYWQPMGELIRPHGSILVIVGNRGPLPMEVLKQKSVRLCWEFMFSRSASGGEEQRVQGEILDRLADLVEAGEIRSTLTQTLSPINAAALEQAHTQLRSGRTLGKIALQGWG